MKKLEVSKYIIFQIVTYNGAAAAPLTLFTPPLHERKIIKKLISSMIPTEEAYMYPLGVSLVSCLSVFCLLAVVSSVPACPLLCLSS